MAESGAGTYERLLGALCARGVLRPEHRVLVQFAGEFDREVVERLGLHDVTFANLAPSSYSSKLPDALPADAHRMAQPDASFDHVIGHAGLHHCSRPHEALHEMYRLARRTVVAVENQDSALMRLAGRLGLSGSYEHDAVADGGGTSGGVDGTGVPNHVYRWTRREVTKTVASFDPARSVPVEFHTEWLVGPERALTGSMRNLLGNGSSPGKAAIGRGLNLALNGVAARQGNIFAFVIRKDSSVVQPWIGPSGVSIEEAS